MYFLLGFLSTLSGLHHAPRSLTDPCPEARGARSRVATAQMWQQDGQCPPHASGLHLSWAQAERDRGWQGLIQFFPFVRVGQVSAVGHNGKLLQAFLRKSHL